MKEENQIEDKVIKNIRVVDETIASGLKIDVIIKENNKANIKYNVNDCIKDSYDCSIDGLESLIIELIRNVRLTSSNQDIAIERVLERLRGCKLFIWSRELGEIVKYDRGWYLSPREEFEEIFNDVLNLLENSPKRFD
ncbi:MAG: hypothetical protein N4A68_06870 [Maledivibacter sp.]|jgi:hypothetical protein|nr:hypothetical protein [Maledivibacter sp.]